MKETSKILKQLILICICEDKAKLNQGLFIKFTYNYIN